MNIDFSKIKKSTYDKHILLSFMNNIHDINQVYRDTEKLNLFNFLIQLNAQEEPFIKSNKLAGELLMENQSLIQSVNGKKLLELLIMIRKNNPEFSIHNPPDDYFLAGMDLHKMNGSYFPEIDLLKPEIENWIELRNKMSVDKINKHNIRELIENVKIIQKHSLDETLKNKSLNLWNKLSQEETLFEIFIEYFPDNAVRNHKILKYFLNKTPDLNHFFTQSFQQQHSNFVSLLIKNNLISIPHAEHGRKNILSDNQLASLAQTENAHISDFPMTLSFKNIEQAFFFQNSKEDYFSQRKKYLKKLSQELSNSQKKMVSLKIDASPKYSFDFSTKTIDINLLIKKLNLFITPALIDYYAKNHEFNDKEKLNFMREVIKLPLQIIQDCQHLFTTEFLNKKMHEIYDMKDMHPNDKRRNFTFLSEFQKFIKNNHDYPAEKKAFLENLIINVVLNIDSNKDEQVKGISIQRKKI